jgi:hypothetical protein
VLSEAVLQPDPALIAEGWQRRFIAGGDRVQEAVELYTQLGYEVRVEPVLLKELREECQGCQLVALLHFKTLYTRKRERATRQAGNEDKDSTPGGRGG